MRNVISIRLHHPPPPHTLNRASADQKDAGTDFSSIPLLPVYHGAPPREGGTIEVRFSNMVSA
jgi:hypothetical protein